MKNHLTKHCLVLIILLISGYTPIFAQSTNTKWKLVWAEEFNRKQIDTAIWKYEIGLIRNKELQYYTNRPTNAYIEKGNLVIATHREDMEGFKYTSASLQTRGTKSFLYGRIEMRAKLPSGSAIWPAFWTLGNDLDWPNCGEIDIMEMFGSESGDGKVTGNLHWQQKGKHTSAESFYQLPAGEKLADKYRLYAMEWDAERIKFFLDGNCYFTFHIDDEDKAHAFRQAHFLLINTAVHPWTEGAENNSYPQKYTIDYIRVYQKKE